MSKYDVFISYSSRDKDWVRRELLTRIEQAGLKAFIDFRDFTRGAPSIKECERGVLDCRKTLLVLTPNYVASEWTEFENFMVQTLSPTNRDLRMIPLLRATCEKPLRIATLTHIDFTDDADHELAWRQLLTALGAPPPPEPPAEPARPGWYLAHPYPMPPNFTGRVAERQMLSAWLDADATHPLLSLRALGGFGKSALVWHWLTHDVDPARWPRVVWWSFYEGDASFDHFLAEALHYLSGGKFDVTKISGKAAVLSLLQSLQEPGTLLVLDGFERVLRAFGGLDAAYQGDESKREAHERDCISPLAELFLYNVATLPRLRSKVLLTTRLVPRILEARGGGLWAGCVERQLHELDPADAVAFFRARGIRGTDVEITQACKPYGYHPLSLALLVGWIAEDVQQPGDVAAARRLDVGGRDETGLARQRQHQHHVLEVAYDSLTPPRQELLGRIACFRSPVAYDTLQALAKASQATPPASSGGKQGQGKKKAAPTPSVGQPSASTLDADLRDLIARCLLHHDRNENRFDLHPIVRRYAYDRLAAPERAAAHVRLRDYFAAVPRPEKVTRLEHLAPVIELYHHTVHAGQLDEAFTLFRDRLHNPLYYQLGAYALIIDVLRPLFADGEERPPRLKNEYDQGWTLAALANSYTLNGQSRRALPLAEQQIAIREKLSDKGNLAVVLGILAHNQLIIGALRAAESNQRRRVALGREINNPLNQASGHQGLGELLAYRGAFAESESELASALKSFEQQGNVQSQGVVWAYSGLRELHRLRLEPSAADRRAALAAARRALEMADEQARSDYPLERDYVRAHWLLGAAYRVAGDFDQAERHLHEALERCRRINLVEHEADILIDLARLRAATGAPPDAQRLAEEAQQIAQRCGYVLQGADAHLELAKLARARGDVPSATDHARQALTLATCDGPPDYTYKAAYVEATDLLNHLG